MKISLFDPNVWKFTPDMIEHFATLGEERHDKYYDPELVKWADTVWFETADNNIHQATQETINGETAESVGLKDKHVICRVIDIEAWVGLHRNVDWNYVDDVIFIAPHIQKLVEKDIDFSKTGTKVHIIPCGVNTELYNFREKQNDHKIAWVSERWHAKGIDYFLQLALTLQKRHPEYKIYAVGVWADDAASGWYREYIDQQLAKINNVEFVDYVPDMNQFLEDKDYTLCCSKKEAFSYTIAEGMSKGLKPLIHNFYGAEGLWDKKYIWNTIDECIDMITGDFNPQQYRDYVVDNYSLKKMLERFDKEVLK